VTPDQQREARERLERLEKARATLPPNDEIAPEYDAAAAQFDQYAMGDMRLALDALDRVRALLESATPGTTGTRSAEPSTGRKPMTDDASLFPLAAPEARPPSTKRPRTETVRCGDCGHEITAPDAAAQLLAHKRESGGRCV
jgi:hypothetical protein